MKHTIETEIDDRYLDKPDLLDRYHTHLKSCHALVGFLAGALVGGFLVAVILQGILSSLK